MGEREGDWSQNPPQYWRTDPARDAGARLDREILLSLGQMALDGPGGVDGMRLDWFDHQTDRVGEAARAELARRERMESES